MRVAMYYSNDDVRLEEMPVPEIGPREVLMRVMASGICGSDVMEWYRLHKVPLVLGHEVSGVIYAVGVEVSQYQEGDRITVAHHVPCDTCRHCLCGDHTVCDTLRSTNFDPGGFAEYIRIPEINVEKGIFLLPENVSFAAATFVEPVACILRGQRRAGFREGCTVLVIGSGIAGLLHVHIARSMGAGLVMATDVIDHRLEEAIEFGAHAVANAEEDIPGFVRGVNNGCLADLVIVCTGVESAVMQGLDSVERGGTVLLFAPTGPGVKIPISINDIFWRNDVTITTSYAGSPQDYADGLKLVSTGSLRVEEMITHRLGLADTGLGFKMVAHPQDYNSIKIIIEPDR